MSRQFNIQWSTSKVYVAISRRSIQYDVQQVSRQFKASPVRHQCISSLFILSRLMTHHHVNIKRNFNTTRNDSTRQVIVTNHDSSQQTVQDVRIIIQAYCSRQLIKHYSEQLSYNYSSILLTKNNNSWTVQGSLLFSTVPLLTWLQSKFNTKQQ